MEFIRSDRYAQLALYEERNNMYRYCFFMVREREIFSPEEFNV